jgi:glycerophosphoryl diester phosphodiesterase
LVTGWLLLSNADLKDRTEIMAHRGASAAAPENTMAAIVRAIADGAHWVEIDVQRTTDDAVVVIHDRDLMKIGGDPLVVAESPLEEIVAVDIGSWFDTKYANQRIPTLDEVLKRCKDKIKVNIELKYYGWDERLAQKVVEIVEKNAMENDIVVMSLQAKAVRQVKDLRPKWQVGLLSAAALTDIVHEEADFLAVHSRMATPGFVKRVHDAGKLLFVWTVNDAVGIMKMFDLGIDALITDKPELASRLLDQRASIEPAQRVLLAAGILLMGEAEHVNPATDGF